MGKCGKCKFWNEADSKGERLGVCHRFPPVGNAYFAVIFKSDAKFNESASHTTKTWKTNWCGEFKEKDHAKVPKETSSH